MGTVTSQITSPTIVHSTVYSGADQRKHQSSASLAFVWGIHRGPVNSPHKWPVTRKMLQFDDVIMNYICDDRGDFGVMNNDNINFRQWLHHGRPSANRLWKKLTLFERVRRPEQTYLKYTLCSQIYTHHLKPMSKLIYLVFLFFASAKNKLFFPWWG